MAQQDIDQTGILFFIVAALFFLFALGLAPPAQVPVEPIILT